MLSTSSMKMMLGACSLRQEEDDCHSSTPALHMLGMQSMGPCRSTGKKSLSFKKTEDMGRARPYVASQWLQRKPSCKSAWKGRTEQLPAWSSCYQDPNSLSTQRGEGRTLP